MTTCHEEMRQFTVVCRVALALELITSSKRGGFNANKCGYEEFGLNNHQVGACIGRARDEIEECARLNRIRKAGRVNFPTRSDELIARMHKNAA